MIASRQRSFLLFRTSSKRRRPGKLSFSGRKAAALCLLLILASGLNSHVVILQLYGWTGMILDYRAEDLSWGGAVDKALRGESPCGVCRTVETAMTQSSHASDSAAAEFLSLPWLLLLPPPAPHTFVPPPESISRHSVAGTRPVKSIVLLDPPPPRNAAA